MRELLLVQFNSNMLTKTEDPRAKAYYDKLYRTRPGYYRYGPTWEIPKWMTEAAYNFPKADVMFVDNMDEFWTKMNDYDDLAFSALDCNKYLIRWIADYFKGDILVGGYCDPDYFNDLPNVYWCGDIEVMCNWFGKDYKPGVDYRHFAGAKTIARLTMSTGCSNRCKFCTVENEVKEMPESIIGQQLEQIKQLNSPLVYLDDKTFGQAGNYHFLPRIWDYLHAVLDEFDGFIIQTTANRLLKFSDCSLRHSGIRYVELGVESYNDEILRPLNKPATEKTIQAAVDKLKRLGIKVIPNIMIGLPGETPATYVHTLLWLYENIGAISHVNVYTYVDYNNETVADENRGGDSDLDKSFASAVYDFGMSVLDQEIK